MASIVSHSIAAITIGTAFWERSTPRRIWFLGVACAILPDLDVIVSVISPRLRILYPHILVHRGLSHSLFFAAVVAALVTFLAFSSRHRPVSCVRLFLYFFLATASHGVLDALTNGGRGVAFFAPFDSRRYFFPFRPIDVSPLVVAQFFTVKGKLILRNEAFWVWLPCLGFALIAFFIRWVLAARKSSPTV